jgi:hypothetical protein
MPKKEIRIVPTPEGRVMVEVDGDQLRLVGDTRWMWLSDRTKISGGVRGFTQLYTLESHGETVLTITKDVVQEQWYAATVTKIFESMDPLTVIGMALSSLEN